MSVRDYAAERYNRRTRAIERHADSQAYLADSIDRIASALEAIAIAQSIHASKIGSYGWGNENINTLFSRLWKRLPR